jgi:hypothetical protein
MRYIKILATVAFVATAAMAAPTVAQADPAICHNGVLSDDAGQGCADGLYAQVYGGGAGRSSSGICHDGILSNDAGQGCADGAFSSFRAASSTSSSGGGSYGGSSNPMVNPACESGGNSQVVDASGTYWGKYQFDRSTWIASGGSPGSYGSASEGEQDRVASRVTYDAWPNC